MPSEFLGVAPWAMIAGIVGWIGAIVANRQKRQEKAVDQANLLVVHRDDLTLQIIRTGREEIAAARLEMDDLREEVKKLRAMETHFYHFQQSLDHLEAVVAAATVEEREAAERNARAFLNRMRRLQEAKGTVANEVQRVVSEVSLQEQQEKKK